MAESYRVWSLTDRIWEDCAPLIQKAIDKSHGEWSIEGVEQQIRLNNYQLYVSVSARKVMGCAVTQIVDYEKKRSMTVYWLAGEKMKVWIGNMLEAIETDARRQQCDYVEAYGRKGWPRAVADLGYTEGYRQVIKEL